MKLINRILVATDFSKPARNVLNTAMMFAKTFNSTITLVHVLPEEIDNEKVSKLVNHALKTEMEEAAEKVANAGIKAGPYLIDYGNYSDKIVNAANTIDANLIVVGSGVKEETDAFQLGTTAARVVSKSSKPVLVVKNNQFPEIRNIICPVDFSEESERALNTAAVMARLYKAKLVILSVYERFMGSFVTMDIESVNQKRFLAYEKEFDMFLKKFNLIDVAYEKVVKGGEPSKEILKVIKEKKSDLLIMGTTGRSGVNRILMGSVTERVIRELPCSFITTKKEDVITVEIETKLRDIESSFNAAQELFNKGFYQEAFTEYSKCVELNVMHFPSLKGLAKVYRKLGKEERAKVYEEMAKNILDQRENIKIEEEIRHLRQY